MNEKKQTISFEIKNPEKEEELKEAEDRLQRIDQILSGIQEGWVAELWRISPGWCEGHLETKTIVDSSPIDLNYIADTWGGEVIQLTVKDQNGKYVKRVNVPMRSFPPRSWGEDLLHPRERRKTGEKDPIENPHVDPFGSIDNILSIVERLRGKDEPKIPGRDNSLDLGIIEMLLKFQMQNQRQSGPMGGVDQFIQMASAFKELKGLLGDDSKPASIIDGDNIMGQITGILDSYAKIKAASEPKPRIPRIAPPSPEQIPIPRQIPATQIPSQAPPVGNNGNMSSSSLADLLASLAAQNPDMASDSLILALDKMPDKVRDRVLDNIYNLLDGDEEEFDESGKSMNNIHNATRENGPENSSGK